MQRFRAILEQHYLATIYSVEFGSHRLRLSLDVANPGLAAYLPEPNAEWALIGAVNPLSRAYPTTLNARRHRSLQRLLRRRGIDFHPAGGSSVDGLWSEPAFWIAGAAANQAAMLGHRYAQAALLFGKGTQAAQLGWLR